MTTEVIGGAKVPDLWQSHLIKNLRAKIKAAPTDLMTREWKKKSAH